MDALRVFELTAKASVQGTKAGRAYVRAIRQAYRDARDESFVRCEGCGNKYVPGLVQPCYPCRLAEREEAEEVSEPAPPVPSSSAGRGVGSPGVSAGAEEPAPPGWRTAAEAVTTADVVRQVLASTIVCGRGHLRIDDARTYDWSEDDWHDWRQAVAAEVSRRIDAAVGATPTPADVPEKFEHWFQK